MTDKLIIINGVDVSDCEHLGLYKEYKLKCGGCYPVDCSDNPNCYYKQLKRKEQEYEELKKNVEHWKIEHKETKAKGEWTYDLVKKRLGQQLDQLKAENDTPRQFLSKEPLALQALQSGYTSYKKSSDVLYEMVKQYKQTLIEIKEITETCSFTDSSELLLNRIKQILQKIIECEGKL